MRWKISDPGHQTIRTTSTERSPQACAARRSIDVGNRESLSDCTADIQTRLTCFESAASVDVKGLEAEFVKIAQQFSENRGVTYGAWRDAGVPAEVLQRAGIKRTRGCCLRRMRARSLFDECAARRGR
jgi:hypothetical protein